MSDREAFEKVYHKETGLYAHELTPLTLGKGQHRQNCNVTACQRPASAFFLHKDNGRYYCFECATDINKFALRVDNVDLFPAMKDLDDCPECGGKSVRAKGFNEGGGTHCTANHCGYWFCY